MRKRYKKKSELTLGRIIAAVVFAILMATLIVFAMYYDPGKQYSNSFFDDVSNAVKWSN